MSVDLVSSSLLSLINSTAGSEIMLVTYGPGGLTEEAISLLIVSPVKAYKALKDGSTSGSFLYQQTPPSS